MNPTDNIIRLMSAKDRKAHGLQTADEAQAKFIARNESDLHKQISSLLSLRGIWFCHSRTDRPTTQRKGVPDFIFAVNGTPVGWEIKFGKNKLSPEQSQTGAHMIRNGWRWQIITSLEQAKASLDLLIEFKP